MSIWKTVNGTPCRVYKTEELTDEEILSLAEKSGTFDFLKESEEDIYTRFDGQSIHIISDGEL